MVENKPTEVVSPPGEARHDSQLMKQDRTIAQVLLTAQSVHTAQTLKAQELPVGGRLSHFWRVWEALGAKESIVRILRDGLKWEFIQKPPLRSKPWKAQSWLHPVKKEAMV